MLILLPLVWLLILFSIPLLVRKRASRVQLPLSILITTIVWSVWLVLITELLGIVNALFYLPVVFAWGITAFFLSAFIIRETRIAEAKELYRDWLPGNIQWRSRGVFHYMVVALLFVQIVLLILVAYKYAPSTWDSMSYHLTRVMQWRQSDSLSHFATSNQRQIQMPPFSEMVFLNIWLLSGSDRWVNFVQIFSFLVSLVAIVEITKQLEIGSNRYTMALLFAASIPMGIVQATSTQNDYVAGMWVLTSHALGLIALRNIFRIPTLVALSLCAGLGVLTKGTAPVFMAPLGFAIAVGLIKKYRFGAIQIGLLSVTLIMLINVGYFSRNFQTYDSILGPTADFINDRITINTFASNTLRNISLHIPVGRSIEPLHQLGVSILNFLGYVHGLLNVGVTDPGTTFGSERAFVTSFGTTIDENLSGNTFHLILIVLFCLLAAVSWNRFSGIKKTYILVVLLVGITYNLVFKWQVWGSRLQLPIFLLWSPLLADMPFLKKSKLWSLVPIALMLFSFRWVINNPIKPGTPHALLSPSVRSEEYFAANLIKYHPYESATDVIVRGNCDQVGFAISGDAQEYQLWLFLEQKGFDGKIVHIDVQNPSKKYLPGNFEPCMILSDHLLERSRQFHIIFESQGIFVYEKQVKQQ